MIDIDKARAQINNNTTQTSPEQDIKDGIINFDEIEEAMIHTFHNGEERGVTTHFPSINPHFTWRKGWNYCWTGWAGHGKSEMILQLALAKAIADKWKMAIYPPESMRALKNPSGEIIKDSHGNPIMAPIDTINGLIFTYHGKSTDKYFKNVMSNAEYQAGYNFIKKHFTFVYPKPLVHTPTLINEHFTYLLETGKYDMAILDPWNKLRHSFSREDIYLSEQFTNMQRMAQKYDIIYNVVAHPLSRNARDKNGTLRRPTEHDISGGTLWDTGMDVIVVIHRPHKEDPDRPNDPLVEFCSKKIKVYRLCGEPGIVELHFDRATNRYRDKNISPIEMLREGKQVVLPTAPALNFSEPIKEQFAAHPLDDDIPF